MNRTQLWAELRPALLCVSTILLMLGTVLTLVALLAIGLRSPEALYVHQIDEFRSVVIGGEGFAVVIQRVMAELGTALLLMITGGLGVLSIRNFSQDPYTNSL